MTRSQESLFNIAGFIGLSHCCVKRRFGVMVYCVVFGCTTTDGCGSSYFGTVPPSGIFLPPK